MDRFPDWHVTGSETVLLPAGHDMRLPRPAAWLLVRSGAATLRTPGGEVAVGPGDAAYLDDAWSARLAARADSRLVVAAVRPGAGAAAPLPRPLVARGFAENNHGVVALLEQCPVVDGWTFPDVERSYGALLAVAMHRAAATAGAEPAFDDDALARVTGAVLSDPDHPWTLDSLAGLVHLSRTTLGERFRAATGVSPMQFVREARMRRARLLLADPERSVTQVAQAVGYGSVAAFSRAFTSVHGRTPRSWRATSARHPLGQPFGARRTENPTAPASASTPPTTRTGVSPLVSRI